MFRKCCRSWLLVLGVVGCVVGSVLPASGRVGVGGGPPVGGDAGSSAVALARPTAEEDLPTVEDGSASWANITGYIEPGPLYNGAVAYDPATNSTILVSPIRGVSMSDEPEDATWSYRNGVWTNLTLAAGDSGIPASNSYLVYDSNSSALLQLGYADSNWSVSEFSNDAWSPIPIPPDDEPPSAYAILEPVYDDKLGSVVWVDDTNPGNDSVWTYTEGLWTNSTPDAGPNPHVYDSAVAYDPGLGCVVLWGGRIYGVAGENSTYSNRTWVWCGAAWSEIEASSSPYAPGAEWGYLAVDPELGGDVLADEWLDTGDGQLYISWYLFSGENWTNLTFQTAPPISALPGGNSAISNPLTFDSGDGYLLLLGGAPQDGNTSIGQGCCRQAWALATSFPPFVTISSEWNPVEVGEATPIYTTAELGSGPFRFDYTGLPPGCASQNASTFICDPVASGNYSIQVEVTDSSNRSGYAVFVLVVVTDVVVRLTVSPGLVDVMQPVNISLTYEGGLPPYAIGYQDLPSGCPAQNRTNWSCVPLTAGNYTIVAGVADSVGLGNSSSANLTVDPALVLQRVYVTHRLVDEGFATEIVTEAVGGTPPYTFTYSSLPAGCKSANSSSISCATNVSGTFTATATVVDCLGKAEVGTVTWNVTNPPEVTRVRVSPGAPTVGLPANLTLNVQGGVPPFMVTWGGLGSGALHGGLSLSWTPLQTGTFYVTANLTDADGDWASLNFTLNVTSLASPHSTGAAWVVWIVAGAAAIAGTVTLVRLLGRGRPRRPAAVWNGPSDSATVSQE